MGRETVVANPMDDVEAITEASAVGPSIQGLEKSRWSLAHKVPKPSRFAVSL